jgi:AcrR family transcriptional regulator
MGADDQASPGSRPSRPYRSAQRQDQARRTRARVIAAARDAFLADGYAGTTVRAVASAAGVSVATVEQAFGTKAELLRQVIDVAIAGDDEPIGVLQRGPAAEAGRAGTASDFLHAVAAILTAGQQRSARLVVVAAEAAAADVGLRPVVAQRLELRAVTAAWIVDGVVRRRPLRPDLAGDHAVDTVWLLMDPVVFCRLTEDRGWSAEHYQEWFADSVQRLLLPQ